MCAGPSVFLSARRALVPYMQPVTGVIEQLGAFTWHLRQNIAESSHSSLRTLLPPSFLMLRAVLVMAGQGSARPGSAGKEQHGAMSEEEVAVASWRCHPADPLTVEEGAVTRHRLQRNTAASVLGRGNWRWNEHSITRAYIIFTVAV